MGFKDFKKVLLSTLLIQAKMTQLNCQRRLKIRNYSLRAIYTKSYTCTSNAKPELLKFYEGTRLKFYIFDQSLASSEPPVAIQLSRFSLACDTNSQINTFSI